MITSVLPLISTHTQDPVIILFNSSAESLLYTHKKKTQQKKNPARLFTLLCFVIPPCLIFFQIKENQPTLSSVC